jgi:hypothetical protein
VTAFSISCFRVFDGSDAKYEIKHFVYQKKYIYICSGIKINQKTINDMKNLPFTLLFAVLSLTLQQNQAVCRNNATGNTIAVSNFRNSPLPRNPASLKILGIGNSFTEDGMGYLPDLLENAGISNVTLGKLVLGGCSLERHCRIYASGDSLYSYQKSYPGKNTWEDAVKKCTFIRAVADEDWDIIVIQQVSSDAGMYSTYQPYLNLLIDAIVTNCSNAGVSLAWQMTWAYGSASDHQGFANYSRDQKTMYGAIVAAVREMIPDTGIDIVIPSGTAIQNMRTTAINNPPLDFTRDGYHIDPGAGRYTLACTWFQTLVAPCLGITVAGNPFRTDNGKIPVNDATARLCQRAAQYACSKRFEVSAAAAVTGLR